MVGNVAMHHIYKKNINTIVIIQQLKLTLHNDYILLYICLHIIYANTVSLSITIFIFI